jgi:hypothetical protein
MYIEWQLFLWVMTPMGIGGIAVSEQKCVGRLLRDRIEISC